MLVYLLQNMSYIRHWAPHGPPTMSPTSLWTLCTFATVARCDTCRAGVPNLAALRFRSLTPVSNSLSSAGRVGLSAVRVVMPMSLLAGWGVLLCSALGRPVLPSAVRIGVYVVLHPLCGDWPSLLIHRPDNVSEFA